jgi:hypothetical protein
VLPPALAEADHRTLAVDPLHRDRLGLEADLPAVAEPPCDEILHHLLLPVEGDRLPSGQLREVDPVARAEEPQLDPLVDETLALEPLADAGRLQQLDRAVLENPSTDALLDVLAAAHLEDDRLDAVEVEEVGQDEPGGPRADDADLRPHPSSSTPGPGCPVVIRASIVARRGSLGVHQEHRPGWTAHRTIVG